KMTDELKPLLVAGVSVLGPVAVGLPIFLSRANPRMFSDPATQTFLGTTWGFVTGVGTGGVNEKLGPNPSRPGIGIDARVSPVTPPGTPAPGARQPLIPRVTLGIHGTF